MRLKKIDLVNIDTILTLNILFNLLASSWFLIFNKGYPIFAFLTSEIGRFDDFWSPRASSRGAFYQTDGAYTIWPLALPLYKFFATLEYRFSLLVFISISLVFIFIIFIKLKMPWKFFILFMTLYPTYFTISRGNNDLILFCILLLFVFLTIEKKVGFGALSVILMQFIEPTPYFIFLTRINWKKVIIIFSAIVVFMVTFYLSIYGKDKMTSYLLNLYSFGNNYSTDIYPGSSLHSISLSGSMQTLYYLYSGEFPTSANIAFVTLNYIILVVGAGLAIFFSLQLNLNFIDKLLLVTMIWALSRSVSFDYAQIYVIIPFLLILFDLNSKQPFFLNNLGKGEIIYYKWLALLLFSAFVPKPYVWFTSLENTIGSTLGSFINPLIFLITITVIVHKNQKIFRWRFVLDKNSPMNFSL